MTALSTSGTLATQPPADGFVIAEGGGALILEELEHARSRGAHLYAELFGAASTAEHQPRAGVRGGPSPVHGTRP